MDVKLCKMDSKAGPRACPKPLEFCPDYFSLTTRGICLNCFDIMIIDV